jgi:N-acetylneuraminic acid mutarotase
MRVGVVDNKIYVLGGYDEEWKVLRVNEVYDPATNTWTTKAPIPTSRADFAIAVYQNKSTVSEETSEEQSTITKLGMGSICG